MPQITIAKEHDSRFISTLGQVLLMCTGEFLIKRIFFLIVVFLSGEVLGSQVPEKEQL